MQTLRERFKRPSLPAHMVNPWGEATRCPECADTGLVPIPGAAPPVNFAGIEAAYIHCPQCLAGERMAKALAVVSPTSEKAPL